MFFKIAAASLAVAGLASALPKGYEPASTNYGCPAPSHVTSTVTPTPTSGTPSDAINGQFSIIALRSSSPVHLASVSASKGRLFALGDQSDVECDDGSKPNFATFEISNKELFLYSKGKPRMRIWFDRSGFGQGIMGYMPEDQLLGNRWETVGWSADEYGNLKYNGNSFLACPSGEGKPWFLWAAVVEKPAGIEGCLSISARAVPNDYASTCEYSLYKPT